METILENILQSPKLELYFQKIRDILLKEHEKRENFYMSIKEGDKVEFINGETIFHSPVKFRHNETSFHLAMVLNAYVRTNNLGFVGHEKIMISLSRNDYEPDICFFVKSKSDKFTPKQMQFPAPDLIVEVLSESTISNDRIVKFEDYAAHGVNEYWIIDPELHIVEQYILKADKYELIVKSDNGVLRSPTITGFEIPISSIFDPEENLSILQKILSPK